MTNNDMI